MKKTDSRNRWLDTRDIYQVRRSIDTALDQLNEAYTRLAMVEYVESMSPQEIEECKALMKELVLMHEPDNYYEVIYNSKFCPLETKWILEQHREIDIFHTVFNERYPFKSSHPALKAVEDD